MKINSIAYCCNSNSKKHIFNKSTMLINTINSRNNSLITNNYLPISFYGNFHNNNNSVSGYDIAEIKDGEIINKGSSIKITSTEDLEALSNSPKQWDNKKFILSADIDLSEIKNWKPIGDKDTPFSGKFYANNHVISNLKINSNNNQGLFGNIENATIHNLKMNNAEVNGNNQVGILVGLARNSLIENIHIQNSKVNGDERVGGIVGISENCNISKTFIQADINGTHDVGGISGFDTKSKISEVCTDNILKGKVNAGGLLGYGNCSHITNSFDYSEFIENDSGNLVGKAKFMKLSNNVCLNEKIQNAISINTDSNFTNTFINKSAIDNKSLQNLDNAIWEKVDEHFPHLKLETNNKSYEEIVKKDLSIYMEEIGKIPDKILKSDFLDINYKDKNNRTPFFYCTTPEQIEYLILKEADVNHKDNNGQTALHKYAQSGDIEIIKKLIEFGGNLEEHDYFGKTPLDIAQDNGFKNITNELTNLKGFSKVIGMVKLKRDLKDAFITPSIDKEKSEKYGLTTSNGVLLYGLPGCGKTFIAKALVEETGRNLYEIKASDISTYYAGDSARAIKDIFKLAKENPPAIVFIDEIDGIAPSREKLNDSNNSAVSQDMKERVTELLQQMNNLSTDNIFVIAAANNPEDVDSAVKRPGRIDTRIFVAPPDKIARAGLFRKNINGRYITDSIQVNDLAQITQNYTAEEIKLVVDTAAKIAMRENRRITQTDLIKSTKIIKPSITQQMIDQFSKKASISETIYIPNEKRTTLTGFKNVAGMNDLKAVLTKDVIEPLKKVDLYKRYGLTTSNGILLYGPPGCGKTFIAKALAEESDRFFISMKPSNIISPYSHMTTLNIKKIFDEARYNEPAIIFIDEIEALAPSRSLNASLEANEQVAELLQQINDCSKHNIVVLAATNEPQKIDEAILRAGRFDKKIFVGPPDKKAREELLRKAFDCLYIEKNLNFEKIADLTYGYTAPQIIELQKAAGYLAMNENKPISEIHLLKAIQEIKPEINENKVQYYKDKI